MNLPGLSTVLLLGTENPIALPVIRLIGTSLPYTSIHTLSAESDAFQISSYSKFISRHHTLKATEGEEFVREVIQKIKDIGADILLPVNETYTRIVSVYREELAHYVKIPPTPSLDLFDTVVRKDRLAELLKTKGLPVPETHCLTDIDPGSLPDDFFPCLIKPVRGSSGNGVRRLDHPSLLESVVADINDENYILQELIPGEDIDCSFIAVDGVIKAYTIQRGIAAAGYSYSTAIRFEHNSTLFEQVERFIREISYSGIAHLDYRLDKRDNVPKLVDFNARYWFSIYGSQAAGVNFVLLNCMNALNMPYSRPDFNRTVYLMGRSTFSRYYGNLAQAINGQCPVHTDLKSRLSDPLPELFRYL